MPGATIAGQKVEEPNRMTTCRAGDLTLLFFSTFGIRPSLDGKNLVPTAMRVRLGDLIDLVVLAIGFIVLQRRDQDTGPCRSSWPSPFWRRNNWFCWFRASGETGHGGSIHPCRRAMQDLKTGACYFVLTTNTRRSSWRRWSGASASWRAKSSPRPRALRWLSGVSDSSPRSALMRRARR